MKKRLLTLVLSIGMLGLTQVNATVSAICFTDGFGYVTDATATRTAPGYWTLSGSANVLTGYDWSVTGYYDKALDFWSITFTNTLPDGCTFYVDAFTYSSTEVGGGHINFNWTSYCFGAPLFSGTGTTTFGVGPCPFRTSLTAPQGPISSDEAIASIPVEKLVGLAGAPTLSELLSDATLSVINNSKNNVGISFQLDDNTNVEITIYNHVGQFIATIVNENKGEGFYNTYWNGKTSNGTDALEGMYIVVMKTDMESLTHKFIK